jgi:hypothetical protein
MREARNVAETSDRQALLTALTTEHFTPKGPGPRRQARAQPGRACT